MHELGIALRRGAGDCNRDGKLAELCPVHRNSSRTNRLTEAELIVSCEPRLPYFAVPRYLEFVHELPATESGKVQKYKLRERGVTERTWDREASHERPTRQSGAR